MPLKHQNTKSHEKFLVGFSDLEILWHKFLGFSKIPIRLIHETTQKNDDQL